MKSTNSTRRNGSRTFYSGLAATGVATGAVLAYSPALQHRLVSPRPGCLFRQITGLKCPFCGMTHAVIALAHGHLMAAVQQNAIVLLLALASAIALSNTFTRGRSTVGWLSSKVPAANVPRAAILAAAYSVVRDV